MGFFGINIAVTFLISGDKAGWCVDKSSAVVTECGGGHECLREGPKRSIAALVNSEEGPAVTGGSV